MSTVTTWMLALVLWLSLSPLPALAATLHVSVQGSDSNPCTPSAPCRTINHATPRLQAGDTLLIGPGVYAENEIHPPSGTTLRAADPGNRPVLRPGGGSNVIHVSDRQNVTIDGLDLDGSNGAGGRAVGFPLYGTDGAIRNITITNSAIHHGTMSCLLLGGTEWTITNNQIYDCGTDGNFDHGIYFTGNHSTIAHNRFDNSACFHIHNYSDPQGLAGFKDPSHNTYESNVLGPSGCGSTLTHGTGLVFRDNLILEGAARADFGHRGIDSLTRGQALIEGNLFRRGGIYGRAGDDAGLTVQGNTLCEGRIETHQATVRDNRFACAGLDLEAEIRKRVTGRTSKGVVRRPTPKNLRVVVAP